jgi:hypothetical protein
VRITTHTVEVVATEVSSYSLWVEEAHVAEALVEASAEAVLVAEASAVEVLAPAGKET